MGLFGGKEQREREKADARARGQHKREAGRLADRAQAALNRGDLKEFSDRRADYDRYRERYYL